MRTLMLCLVVVGACGGHDLGSVDDTVGNACTSDANCDVECLPPSGDYPNGFCTLPCNNDSECPGDTYCVDDRGGVCLFICPAFRCSDLGPGWQCRDADHAGGGTVTVCRG